MKDYFESVSSYPLTESQKGVYFECMENPSSTAYNIPFAVKLPKGINPDKFESAVKKAALLHPAFFVNIRMQGGEPVMVKGSSEVYVRRTVGNAEEAEKSLVRPFDLANGPLFRFEICEDEGGVTFLLDVHHIIFDGSSVKIFLSRIADIYDGREAAAEKNSVIDFAAKENEMKAGDEYASARDFFGKMLDGRDFNSGLIPDRREKCAGFGKLSVASPSRISPEAVKSFTKKNGITAATLFTASFAYALSVFAGSDESCFTTVSSGRHCADMPDSVGMFVKTLPICIDINPEESVSGFLTGFHKTFHGAVRNECISFAELAAEYGVKADVFFVYQGDLFSEAEIGGEKVFPEYLFTDEYPSDILLMMTRKAGGYELLTFFNKALYTEEYAVSLCETVFEIAAGMMEAEKLRDIGLVSPSQMAFISSFNSTEKDYGADETVNSVFEKSVCRYAGKTALVFKDRSYSYSEFDRITKNIAGYISSLGLGAEEFVAVLAPRDDYAVLSAWGVIRSGCAFQMLDGTYPPERINYMLSDGGAKLLIADRDLFHLIEGFGGTVLYTDEISGLPACGELMAKVKPENAITMIYTSGTTGKPKGSVLENRNLLAFFRSHSEVMGIDETSHIATYASFGFDAGIMDIITAMLAGAALYVIPDEIRLDMPDVERFYNDNSITHGFMTTQVGRMFAEITKCKTLKAFMVGGEKLVPFKVQDGFRFLNGYGPCETMAYVCHQEVRDNYLLQPIGKPSRNIKLFVADKSGRLLPAGAVGELCISGAQVGRGYLGLPEKTAEVFVRNPFCEEAGYERMYKSGDVVRLLPEGSIDYVGRRDGQVKIRGYRVELTEIEEIIRRFEGVEDATVTAFDDAGGGKYIAAYVAGSKKIDTAALHRFIGAEKPSYMIPRVTMQLDKIPYNQNQKVNRRALPVPQAGRQSSKGSKKPATELQKKIHSIAARVLGNGNFGVDSDLFECGMTSIGLLRFNSLLSEELGLSLSISDIRRNGTVEAIEALSGKEAGESFSVMADYPLMKNQLGVYLDGLRNEGSLIYNIPVLLKLSPEIDTESLKNGIIRAINAHPYIKSTLRTDENGDVRLVRNDSAEAKVSVIEEESLPREQELVRPFAVVGGELYRAEIHVTPSEKYLFIDVHHIISDGTSLAVLVSDINLACGGGEVKEEDFTCFDVSLSEEKTGAEDCAAAGEYFEELLSDCNTECLPAPCPADVTDGSGQVVLEVKDSAKIISFCGKNKISQNAFFNAVFGFTLSELISADDVTYCTVYNGRSSAGTEHSFGMLVKTLPVRFAADENSKVLSAVASVQKQLLDTMTNDSVPYMDLSAKYGLKPDIFFNYQGDNFIFDNIGGREARLIDIDILPAKAPLCFEVFLEKGVFRIKASFSRSCFNGEFVSSFASAIAAVAVSFTEKDSLSGISVFSESEKVRALPKAAQTTRKTVRSKSADKALEKKLCELFATVTGAEEVLADDDFFAIGGTSLSASKVTMMLMSEGIEVKYGDIFDNPTPAELAGFIRERDGEKSGALSAEEECTTREALKHNTVRDAKNTVRKPLGNVLLTGAVGFLGIHILKELLEIEDGHIYCLVRKGSFESSEVRLRTMLFYYFSDGFADALRDRITLIDGDITDSSLAGVLEDVPFDTVINCAACVKHFADGDIIERINVRGVENLIEICSKRDKKLIQISTTSVPGIHTKESYEKQVRMHENELFVIDDMDNKYGISKYHAELRMFEAIEGGMRGKVLRAGNLMGRHSDGEFQANIETNMFLSGIRGFAAMGKYPISHMTDPMRFSPVDCTARAMVLLSGTNDEFTAFNCDNRYGFDEMKVIDACNRNGITILPEDDETYYAEFRKKLGDASMNSLLNGLAAYDIPDAHTVETDNLFTTNVLYRIGFSWPLVDDSYLDRAINSIMTLDYFGLDSVQDNSTEVTE